MICPDGTLVPYIIKPELRKRGRTKYLNCHTIDQLMRSLINDLCVAEAKGSQLPLDILKEYVVSHLIMAEAHTYELR